MRYIATVVSLYICFAVSSENPDIRQLALGEERMQEFSDMVLEVESKMRENIAELHKSYRESKRKGVSDDCNIEFEKILMTEGHRIYKGTNLHDDDKKMYDTFAALIFLQEIGKFDVIFDGLKKYLHSTSEKGHIQIDFYDEVLDRISDKRQPFIDFSIGMNLEEALQRHFYIEFLVFLVAECHENHQHLKLFAVNKDLLFRNYLNILNGKKEKYIFIDVLLKSMDEEYRHDTDLDSFRIVLDEIEHTYNPRQKN